MKKYLITMVVIVACIMGASSAVWASAMAELIEHIGVAKIVSMEIRPLYRVTEETLAWLKAENVPEQICLNPQLLSLKDQTYDGRDAFLSALERALDSADLDQEIEGDTVRILLLRYARQRPSERHSGILDVAIDISNSNDRDIKLTESLFDFSLRDEEAMGGMIQLGKDVVYRNTDIDLPANPEHDPEKVTRVVFSIELQDERKSSFDPLVHLLNFSGNPAQDDYLFVNARFTLGMKSSKGWTYGEAIRVEWMFCPDMQNQLPLQECFIELPPPAPDFPGTVSSPLSIACDNLVKAGRNIIKKRTDYYIADLGETAGTFHLDFETYTEPDQILVEYEGKVLYDTGCVGASGSETIAYSGTTSSMKVSVTSRCRRVGPSVTDWDFKLSCPE
ncbi:hypothetical protein CSB45_02910 [candidate division KSB3 bacterium]|uniref:Uncharacterized protein n=1 Tax=candidate division KSB3 bacterium TaxID=2044937 RepID=A0A2G6E9Q5_9BACT|nr:MAG: hypothetical protein CSB45_02910 [candidate division KSB3 bacterium]